MAEPHNQEKIPLLLALGKPDEAALLEQHLLKRFGGALEIYRAPSGFDAMSLAMNQPRAVLLDQRLPDVLGLDMIEPVREQIGNDNYIIFVGGTGKAGIRPGMRDEALRRGANALFDRPVKIDILLDTLHKLLYPKPPEHPHLHGLELIDLIQAYHNKRVDRTIRIFGSANRVGSIYMLAGEVTHIECGPELGFTAMLDLMSWAQGVIEVYDACLSAERTNKLPTQSLILDAARAIDEGSQGGITAEHDPTGQLFGEDIHDEELSFEALDAEEDSGEHSQPPPQHQEDDPLDFGFLDEEEQPGR